MAEIVNLKRAKKLKARAKAETEAAANRALHGRSKAEKRRDAIETSQAKARLDGAKRDPEN